MEKTQLWTHKINYNKNSDTTKEHEVIKATKQTIF